jgi:dTDP-4-dehydrorhamnose 3,5-epimerase
MLFLPTALPGVVLIEPVVHGDERGFFLESYHAERFAEAGLPSHFAQDNHSRSSKGILRGLHYQEPHPQGKLARVVRGAVFDVAVDIRRGSPFFGRWVGCELSEDNKRMLWIPPGFAHGFYVLSAVADFLYKCTETFHPEADRSILWNDPDIGIAWPLDGEPVLSAKDGRGSLLRNAEPLPACESASG